MQVMGGGIFRRFLPIGDVGGPVGELGQAIDFNGTTDFLGSDTLSIVGALNNFSCSFWINTDSSHNMQPILFKDGIAGDRIIMAANPGPYFQLWDSGGRFHNQSFSKTISPTGGWYHLAIAVNATTGAWEYWFNGTSAKSGTGSIGTVEWASSEQMSIGAHKGGWNFLNGQMSEVWITDEYVDFGTLMGNFMSSNLPVDLGSDGSTPTGRQPLIYMRGDAAVWNAGTNLGTLPDFTPNGTFIDADAKEPVIIGVPS